MSDGAHLLISFASSSSAGCRRAFQELSLPNLQRLLARLSPGPLDAGTERSLTPPHERVLGRALGLYEADGLVPWAAWQMRQAGQPVESTARAWVTPCHWAVGRDHIAMALPSRLQLDAAQSQALLATVQPYFVQDGLSLTYQGPGQWIAEGELLRRLPCASLDRVAGRMVDSWLPRGAEARDLRRLQQEIQMLLYTHPVNAEREARGQPVINSFWVSGAGALVADYKLPPARDPAEGPPPSVRVDHRLRDPALSDDWPAWSQAWRELDANAMPRLLETLERGRPVTLTLCGESSARTWSGDSVGLFKRLAGALRSPSVAAALEPL